jgi:hypothetical protein
LISISRVPSIQILYTNPQKMLLALVQIKISWSTSNCLSSRPAIRRSTFCKSGSISRLSWSNLPGARTIFAFDKQCVFRNSIRYRLGGWLTWYSVGASSLGIRIAEFLFGCGSRRTQIIKRQGTPMIHPRRRLLGKVNRHNHSASAINARVSACTQPAIRKANNLEGVKTVLRERPFIISSNNCLLDFLLSAA